MFFSRKLNTFFGRYLNHTFYHNNTRKLTLGRLIYDRKMWADFVQQPNAHYSNGYGYFVTRKTKKNLNKHPMQPIGFIITLIGRSTMFNFEKKSTFENLISCLEYYLPNNPLLLEFELIECNDFDTNYYRIFTTKKEIYSDAEVDITKGFVNQIHELSDERWLAFDYPTAFIMDL